MSRYIDAEPIEQFIADGLNRVPKENAMGFDAIEILAEIHFAPTADVAPVIHSFWERVDEFSICHNCAYNGDRSRGFVETKYCPQCGAKMHTKENEE